MNEQAECHKFFYFPYLILSPASIDAPDAPDGADGANAPLYFDALMRPDTTFGSLDGIAKLKYLLLDFLRSTEITNSLLVLDP